MGEGARGLWVVLSCGWSWWVVGAATGLWVLLLGCATNWLRLRPGGGCYWAVLLLGCGGFWAVGAYGLVVFLLRLVVIY